MDAWNENSPIRKKEKITAFIVSEMRTKIKQIMVNVSDSREYVLGEIHDCDVLYLTLNNYGVEYAINVSEADLLADSKKLHDHEHDLIKQTYFIVPTELVEYAEKILPKKFGIIEYAIGLRKKLYPVRKAKMKKAVQWTEKQQFELYKNGYQRYLTITEEME